jgi:hypothetical protein
LQIMTGRKVPRDVRLIVGMLAACPIEHGRPDGPDGKEKAVDDLTFL